jgi:hypothetical protein
VLLSASPACEASVLALAREHRVPVAAIGTVGAPGDRLRIALREGEVSWPIAELQEIYERAIPRRMEPIRAQEAAD